MSAKQVEQLRKQVAQLQAQIADREAENAQLQGEDSAQDLKIEQLSKLQAQKVRALMRSIQELKKENATLKRQSAEHKRSDLIEKLKSEIDMQDVVIEALRSLVSDEEKCNKKIEEFLNRGPPRIRAVSREEMRIEIKKLKATIAGLQAKAKGAKAADDFDKLMSQSQPPEEEEKGVDTQHNEKIVELLEELENMRVELSSKDVKIEYLKKTIQKLNLELGHLRMKENELEFTGQVKTNLESQVRELQEGLQESATGQATHASSVQEKELQIRELNSNIRDLEARIQKGKEAQGVLVKQYQSEREDMKVRLAKAQADILELRAKQDSRGRQGEIERQKLKELLGQKDEQIAKLTSDLRNTELRIDELQREVLVFKEQQAGSETQEVELLLLREQLVKLAKSQNVPSDMLKAETTRADTFKKRTLELTRLVADLQEKDEHNAAEIAFLRKQGAAISLHNKRLDVPREDDTAREDYKALVAHNLGLQDQISLLETQLKAYESEAKKLHSTIYEGNQRISVLEQEARRSVQLTPQVDLRTEAMGTLPDLQAQKSEILGSLTGMFPQLNIDMRKTGAQAAINASTRIKDNLLRVLAK